MGGQNRPLLTDALRQRRRCKIGRSWYVDETHLKVGGRRRYLHRAIDSDGALSTSASLSTATRSPLNGSSARPWR
ncbi:DDE-type integrase/transposase/recombinase [Azospirillum sp. Marseille-Q6669]